MDMNGNGVPDYQEHPNYGGSFNPFDKNSNGVDDRNEYGYYKQQSNSQPSISQTSSKTSQTKTEKQFISKSLKWSLGFFLVFGVLAMVMAMPVAGAVFLGIAGLAGAGYGAMKLNDMKDNKPTLHPNTQPSKQPSPFKPNNLEYPQSNTDTFSPSLNKDQNKQPSMSSVPLSQRRSSIGENKVSFSNNPNYTPVLSPSHPQSNKNKNSSPEGFHPII